jgi:uncharacterized membrane protein YbhN (UPF0104 family)
MTQTDDLPLSDALPLAEAAAASAPRRTLLKHPLLRILLILILVGGVAYTLWLSFQDPKLADFEWHFYPVPVGIGAMLMLATSATTAALWLVIFRSLGGRVETRAGCRIYMVTNLGKYLPGKVMHAAGRVALLQERGQAGSLVVTSVLVELVLSLLGAALLSLIVVPGLLQQPGLQQYTPILTTISLLALPAGLIGLHPRVMGPVLKVGSKMLPGRAGELATHLPPYRTTLLLLVGYMLLWFLMSMGLFATAHTVYPLDWEHLPAMTGIAAISYLFGLAVPIAPAGIGAREGLMTALLSTLTPMPVPAAAVASVLYRVVTILAETLAAGLGILLDRQRQRRAPCEP